MTLHVFPDPRADVQALLEAGAALWPEDTTISTRFPDRAIAAPRIQHAWDGTPGRQVNRETATIRVTVWSPRGGKLSDAILLAGLVEAYLLAAGSAVTWRFLPGAGRTPGTDPDTQLPFCVFTVTAETRPFAVS